MRHHNYHMEDNSMFDTNYSSLSLKGSLAESGIDEEPALRRYKNGIVENNDGKLN